ncbi:hypothetical protein AVEN_206926-1 [Araneus ventricosus]|uniref:Uncharacterized protein n=1 Tax=Araneus ventricosus TaxID=182803 RepID=A0A4Y2IZD5_ARAVE|nr:hypothetical protein AVEN_206926-1 [Araneus ventricosus]
MVVVLIAWSNTSSQIYESVDSLGRESIGQTDPEHLMWKSDLAVMYGSGLPSGELSGETGSHLCSVWRKTRNTSYSHAQHSEKFAAKIRLT